MQKFKLIMMTIILISTIIGMIFYLVTKHKARNHLIDHDAIMKGYLKSAAFIGIPFGIFTIIVTIINNFQ